MFRRVQTIAWIVIVVLALLCPNLVRATLVDITILHMNDFHGHMLPYIDKTLKINTPVGGAARISWMIQKVRSRNPDGTILLSAGDMFQGTPLSNIFEGQPVIEFMNAVRFDAMALGNHEFDWGMETLSRLSLAAEFPFLSANVIEPSSQFLSNIKPYVIVNRKGIRFAVIGLTTPDTAWTTRPEVVKGVRFSAPQDILPTVIDKVKTEGANFIIVLSHLGLDVDRQLASAVSGIDLIVGGHSHTAVTDPVKVNHALIVQAGYYGAYLGVLQLSIDPETLKTVSYTEKDELEIVYSGPGEPVDPNVGRIVDLYNDQIRSEMSKVIGESSVDLQQRPYEESNLGNMICDALKEDSRADLAFFNGGGIRADIPKGKIILEQIYTTLPFDNVVVTMDLTGEQILQLLEQNAGMENKILQCSGLRVHYDMSRPFGSRVTGALVGDQPIRSGMNYRVATNDFLAAGGDHFTVFQQGTNLTYGKLIRDVVVLYLKTHCPVHPSIEGRITISGR